MASIFPPRARLLTALGVGAVLGALLSAQPDGSAAGASLTAGSRIEAERFTQMYGVTPQPCDEGGFQLGDLETGDWVLYRGLDLGAGVRGVTARVLPTGSGGTIEIRFNDSLGPVIGTIEVPPAGPVPNWETFQTEVWKIAGTQSICLRFTGDDAFALNWIGFVPSELPPEAPAPAEEVEATGADAPPEAAIPPAPQEPADEEAAPEPPAEEPAAGADDAPPTRVSILFRQEAERWSVADDATILPSTEGGFALHPDRDAASAGYKGFEILRQVNVFAARIAVVGRGGSLELRTDRPDGPILAILPLRETGSLDTFATFGIPAEIPADTYDLFVVFRIPEGQSCALNWFGFVEREP